MEKQNKAKTIINAFTEALPVGEPWYEQRKSICDSCEYNSKNSEANSLKDVAQDLLHGGVPFCRACLCFIDRKCSRKEETCGLIEKNLEPKWKALAVLTVNKEDWNIYNNTPEKGNIDLSESGDAYIFDYGQVNAKADTQVQLVLEGVLDITAVQVGCGAGTTAIWNKIGEGMFELNVKLKMDKINKGNFRKNVYISYGENNKVIIGIKGINKI